MIPQINPRSTVRGTFRPPKLGPHSFGITASRIAPVEPEPAAAPPDYDPRIAYLTSVVSGWAYSDGQTLAEQLIHYGLPGNSVLQIPVVNDAMLVVATAYFLRSQDGRVGIIAFRGTQPENFINWLTDADLSLRAFHFGKIHNGVYNNVQAVWNDLIDAVEAAAAEGTGEGSNGHGEPPRSPLQTLYITGHSLGAAMAVTTAARIFTPAYAHLQARVRGIYTFGQPMVGDSDFAQHYESRFGGMLFRHVFRHDVVPHLPPREVDDFRHFGQELFASKPGEGWQVSSPIRSTACVFAVATAAVALADFLARRLRVLRWLNLPYSLEDHSPQRYIEVSRHSLG